jgi:nucleoside 2-deoxyribosyltransferase
LDHEIIGLRSVPPNRLGAINRKLLGSAMKIYLAGPLFTAAELEFNRKVRDLLVLAGHEVWLPQEQTAAAPRTAEAILDKLLVALDAADVIVANMDGADPDSGTSWECGYAFARKKPVVAFRTDVRSERNADLGPYNLMIWASATRHLDGPFAKADDVAAALIEVLDRNLLMEGLANTPLKRSAGAR